MFTPASRLGAILLLVLGLCGWAGRSLLAQSPGSATVPRPAIQRFVPSAAGLGLTRPVRPGAFFDVAGRRAAAFGYEDRALEVWVYPLKLLDDFRLSFALEGYPLEIEGRDCLSGIEVRPEATIFTYSHAAFTVRQILLAPIDEPGLIVLLDLQTALPMRVTASFRPRLRLMWPAGLMTGHASWDAASQRYTIGEDTGRFVGIIGSPGSEDLTLMPYQEEPRDVPLRFVRAIALEEANRSLLPIIMAGSVTGRADAVAAYERLLGSARELYAKNVAFYRSLLARTTDVAVPDERLVEAFRWAKIGVDKGLVTNPLLGTGLVAGFRTSGESERPGYAWFFGRDALWTALAIDAYGDFATTRTALEFLAGHQRDDGKIPHEISQSASLIPWFTDYPYGWASADATPLFVVAHAEHWRASGDLAFLERSWPSILKAYRFSAGTDTDGNGLIENTKVGHGWVEGGALYPPHEEIYLQGVWVAALEGLADLADAQREPALATEVRARAQQVRDALEARYWSADRGHYAFATALPRERAAEAEPGPHRARRQQRLNELRDARLIEEDTVLPAVPLWWGVLALERADEQIDRLGSGALATDWGARLLSSRSRLYDPLSYHYGSVWPLFTGWASMAAYKYGRPHVGYQALVANALLTYDGALGYVTELLSGDFNAPFGRSSHHQVWSEAMVITPFVRGLFGAEVRDGGRALHLRPQLPADWARAALERLAVGRAWFDVTIAREAGRVVIDVEQRAPEGPAAGGGPVLDRLVVGPAFPLDADIHTVVVNGEPVQPLVSRAGDVQFTEVSLEAPGARTRIEFTLRDGSDVYLRREPPAAGADSQGLRILRSRADAAGLRLRLEGRGGRTYEITLRTPRRVLTSEADGVRIEALTTGEARLVVSFDGAADQYVRRDLLIPLAAPPEVRLRGAIP